MNRIKQIAERAMKQKRERKHLCGNIRGLSNIDISQSFTPGNRLKRADMLVDALYAYYPDPKHRKLLDTLKIENKKLYDRTK